MCGKCVWCGGRVLDAGWYLQVGVYGTVKTIVSVCVCVCESALVGVCWSCKSDQSRMSKELRVELNC